jgi:hypothetical protein
MRNFVLGLLFLFTGVVAMPMLTESRCVAQDPEDIAKCDAEVAMYASNNTRFSGLYEQELCEAQHNGTYSVRPSIENKIDAIKWHLITSHHQYSQSQADAMFDTIEIDLAICIAEEADILTEYNGVMIDDGFAAEDYSNAYWYPWYYNQAQRITLYNEARDRWIVTEAGYQQCKDRWIVLGAAYEAIYDAAVALGDDYGYNP